MSLVILFISITSAFAGTIIIEDTKTGPINSYTMGLSMPLASGSGTGSRVSGRVVFQDMTVNRPVDDLGPLLMYYCATGMQLASVKITGDNGSVITLKNVIVTSYSENGFPDSAKAYSQITLNFKEITLLNKNKNSKWNVLENKGTVIN